MNIVIPLTKGLITIIDEEDLELVSKYTWNAMFNGKKWYVRSNELPAVYLHRLLMGLPPKGVLVDHKNGQSLDNRKENLREATTKQNNHNSIVKKKNATGIKGVSFHKKKSDGKPYQARIRGENGGKQSLGYFETAEEAGQAYVAAAIKLHGEFYNGERTYEAYRI